MNSHKCVLNLKLHWVTSSTYHSRLVPTSLQPTILVRCLPILPTIPSHRSHQEFSTAILNYLSTILRISTINGRARFIKNSSRKTHWIMKWRFASFKFSSHPSHNYFTMASSFLTPSNQYCFIINLRSTLSWFGRNLLHNIIVVLRSKQILFLPLTTTFVHKITYNKVCVVVPCFLGLGWPGNPSPGETPVPNLKALVISLQLLSLLAEVVVRNKQQLD